jgi:hypothetical protein
MNNIFFTIFSIININKSEKMNLNIFTEDKKNQTEYPDLQYYQDELDLARKALDSTKQF